MNLTIIGDVHGKIDELVDVIKMCHFFNERKKYVCVGDVGFGSHIEKLRKAWLPLNAHFCSVVGNHDFLPAKDKWPYLGDFRYFEDKKMFTVRGAESIDRIHRTEGLDWFENEELTYAEGLLAYDAYVDCRPNIVVSHECPQSVKWHIFGYPDKTDTNQLLQAMFEAHQPKLWVFGHYHRSVDVTTNGTRFVCLNELETLTINVDDYNTI